MNIVFASSNPGKLRELQHAFANQAITLIPQATLGVLDVPETGLTFVENALIKARHANQTTALPAIADDSGLIVDALHGAPGIYSARYAGPSARAEDNIKKLLEQLVDVPQEKRQAFFYCVIVFLRYAEDPAPLMCEGRWQGTIRDTPSGAQGFGYDPIFFDPQKNCSAAELSLTQKHQCSHRGQALQSFIEKLTCMRSL